MSRKHLLAMGLLFFLSSTFSACALVDGMEKREEIVKTFDLKAGSSISVHNVNGRIEVEAWDQDKVEVRAVKTARGYDDRDATENLKRLEIVFDSGPNSLRIDTRYPSSFHWTGGVEYTLRVPKKVNLSLRTTNGHIKATDVEGQIQLDTTNGAITADNIGGSLRASTTNGKVAANFTTFVGDDLRLSTTNGSIELGLPDQIDANLSAHTTNGSIRSDYPITTRGDIGKHSLEGTLGKGGPLIHLKTTNGSIRISRGSNKTV